jgi:hypothetical protein
MELKTRAEGIFHRFVATGSVGEGASRTEKLGMMDRMNALGGDVYEAIFQQDNNPALDQDPTSGSMRGDAGKLKQFLENGFLAEMEQGMNELLGPAPDLAKLSDEQKAEMRKELEEMVKQGILSQEELDAALNPDAQPGAVVSGTYDGTMTHDADGNKTVIFETNTKEEHDVECFFADGKGGSYFMDVTNMGDHLTVRAVQLGLEGGYKEEMILRD